MKASLKAVLTEKLGHKRPLSMRIDAIVVVVPFSISSLGYYI